eukprot:1160175-Pelagomonas_calceolata.AAC.4
MERGRGKLVEKDEDGVAHQMCMGARRSPADAKRHLEAHCKKLKEGPQRPVKRQVQSSVTPYMPSAEKQAAVNKDSCSASSSPLSHPSEGGLQQAGCAHQEPSFECLFRKLQRGQHG